MKDRIHSVISYIYVLLLLYLGGLVIMLIFKGAVEGFLNLDISWHKVPLILGTPLIFAIVLKFLIKKLE